MNKPFKFTSLILLVLIVFSACIHVNGGGLNGDFAAFWKSIFSFDNTNETQIIYREIRIPRIVMALLAGSSLSIAGLLMQTMFNNPLAGPSVLGITAGSSLFVALTLMTGISFFTSDIGVVASALLGAIVFSGIILLFSSFVKNQVSLLLVGMMLGSFTSAIIQVLEMVAHEGSLKAFTLWGFGSLQQINFDQLGVLIIVFLVSCSLLLLIIKPLNLLVIGEHATKMLGVNINQARLLIIVISSIFTGVITAYCGPISFIGLAVPNVVRLIYRTQNHYKLMVGSLLVGALVLVVCDLLILWIEPFVLLPLNGVTALFGAPVVIWILLKKY